MSKPMIRHCRNCEYISSVDYCTVKYSYKPDEFQRISALLCKFYKQRSDNNENPNKHYR